MSSPRTRRRWLVAALSAALLASGVVSTAAQAQPARDAAPASDVSAAAVAFSDTFDGPAGAAVDGSKWQIETGDNVNNHERQYYTAGNANAALDGQGHLVITARKENPANYQCWYGTCQYTSARLNTSGTFHAQYGHVEARMKIPRGQGMWPAFWMLGTPVNWPDSGEIDIMENVGFEPSTVHGTIHGPGYSGSGGIGAGLHAARRSGLRGRLPHLRRRLGAGPHHLVRGRQRLPDPHARRPGRPPVGVQQALLHHPQPGGGGYWPGDPDGSTAFPQQLLVDHVSVTTSDTSTGGAIRGLAGEVRGRRRGQHRQRHARPALRLQRHRRAALDGGFRRYDPGAGQVPGRHLGRHGRRHARAAVGLQRHGGPALGGHRRP